MFNVVGLYTGSLLENIKQEVNKCNLKDLDPAWDYYNFQACLAMFDHCAQELVMKNNTVNNK